MHFLEPFSQKFTKCSLENGHDRYAVLDMEEYRQYEKLMAMQKLMTELEKGRRSGGSRVLLCGGCGKGTGNP